MQQENTTAGAIAEEVLRDPWATHEEIAERAETTRPYVSEVIGKRPNLRSYQRRAREGVVLYGEGPWGEDLADILSSAALFEEDGRWALQELARRIQDGRIEAVRITPIPDGEA